MNSPLKFRAWDEKYNCWDSTPILWHPYEDCIKQGRTIQWFTGLTDKNGKEIYEGDILEWKGEFIADVFFEQENAAFVVKSKKGVGGFMSENYMLNFQIIGNIFEHKHLLK